MASTFHVSVVTPEREVLKCEARFAAIPAFDGEMGILPGRAALLTQLGSGTLRVEEAAGAKRKLFVSGGFAQMVDDKLTLLTEEARDVDQVTADLARDAKSAAGALPRATDEEATKQDRADTRARTLARIARSAPERD